MKTEQISTGVGAGSDAAFVWEPLTCRVDADGPVDPVLSEELHGKRPSVARSVGVHDIEADRRRVLVAESGPPLSDHRAVVILI